MFPKPTEPEESPGKLHVDYWTTPPNLMNLNLVAEGLESHFKAVLSEKLSNLTEIEKDSIRLMFLKEICQEIKYSEFTHPKYFLMCLLVLPHFL